MAGFQLSTEEGDLEAGLAQMRNIRGAVGWDFGAHFGIHTVGMAMQFGPEGEVASFEPDPAAFRRLKHHVQMNRLANVRLFQAAASKVTGSSVLITDHGLGSSCSHFQYEDEKTTARTTLLRVETVAPDELVAQGAIRAPDIIKVDVQGHGAQALQGSAESIRAKLPLVIFSNHSQWELEGSRDLLAPLGYTVRNLTGESMPWEGLLLEAGLLVPPGSQGL